MHLLGQVCHCHGGYPRERDTMQRPSHEQNAERGTERQ